MKCVCHELLDFLMCLFFALIFLYGPRSVPTNLFNVIVCKLARKVETYDFLSAKISVIVYL
jgi:hypothetical protein